MKELVAVEAGEVSYLCEGKILTCRDIDLRC
jgi:hypothetical protein